MSERQLALIPGDGDDMVAPGLAHPAWRGLTEATAPPCEAVHPAFLRQSCGRPSAGPYAKVCEHEHVEPRWLCAVHVALAETGLCAACYLHRVMPHKCHITLVPAEESE